MTRKELRDYVEEQRSLNMIPYHVYSALIDGIDTANDLIEQYNNLRENRWRELLEQYEDALEDAEEELLEELLDELLDLLEEAADECGETLKPVRRMARRFLDFPELYDDCIKPLFEDCVPGDFDGDGVEDRANALYRKKQSSTYPSYVDEYNNKLNIILEYIDLSQEQITNFFGYEDWMYIDEEELKRLKSEFFGEDYTYIR